MYTGKETESYNNNNNNIEGIDFYFSKRTKR